MSLGACLSGSRCMQSVVSVPISYFSLYHQHRLANRAESSTYQRDGLGRVDLHLDVVYWRCHTAVCACACAFERTSSPGTGSGKRQENVRRTSGRWIKYSEAEDVVKKYKTSSRPTEKRGSKGRWRGARSRRQRRAESDMIAQLIGDTGVACERRLDTAPPH